MSPTGGLIADEGGSAPVEFVLVGLMLTVLTLGVMQFGVAVYVRNVVHDAAVDGAYHAALADTTITEGAERTRDIVSRTVGAEYAHDVSVNDDILAGHPTVVVSVRTTMPLIGLLGVPGTWEVSGHAPIETFE